MNFSLVYSAAFRWETFPHMADIGIRGFGNSPKEALEAVSFALISVITDPQKIEPQRALNICCEADSYDLILYDWLNSLIFKMATENMLFCRFDICLSLPSLQGVVWGETVDRHKHSPAVEIKGATFSELFFGQGKDGLWIAQCIVDV
ncbi:archease [Methylacidiphilum caldifontis]|uniref:Archease n=1 Tax=Methylacidiphilum caldifontis TaxID=2795386 RepID=A0A4Y8PEX9_9BACT|nr:archease [Methylacidiphilum caldifontis]QSR88258.1 archease [Methylacidiphilum caldifontis]TFE70572.1 archease [Methylacidiphilum caldifontis]